MVNAVWNYQYLIFSLMLDEIAVLRADDSLDIEVVEDVVLNNTESLLYSYYQCNSAYLHRRERIRGPRQR